MYRVLHNVLHRGSSAVFNMLIPSHRYAYLSQQRDNNETQTDKSKLLTTKCLGVALKQFAPKKGRAKITTQMGSTINLKTKKSSRQNVMQCVRKGPQLRTKLLRWSSFSPHFTQKASFSPIMMCLGT